MMPSLELTETEKLAKEREEILAQDHKVAEEIFYRWASLPIIGVALILGCKGAVKLAPPLWSWPFFFWAFWFTYIAYAILMGACLAVCWGVRTSSERADQRTFTERTGLPLEVSVNGSLQLTEAGREYYRLRAEGRK